MRFRFQGTDDSEAEQQTENTRNDFRSGCYQSYSVESFLQKTSL